MSVIIKLAAIKTERIKCNLQEWSDGEVLQSIAQLDKGFKKFKCSILNVYDEFIIKHSTNLIG